jgi:hypothetical protein
METERGQGTPPRVLAAAQSAATTRSSRSIRSASSASAPRRPASTRPQAAIPDHLERCGFAYLVTDDTAAAIEWLKARGILRGGVVMIG